MQMSLNVNTPEMLVFSILEEVLKLKRVIGGVGMVFYHGLQERSWGGGGGGIEKNYEPSLRSVFKSATAWAQNPCTEVVTFSGGFRPCVLAVTNNKLM